MGSIAALIVECAVVTCTVLGAGVMMLLLHESFSRSVLEAKQTLDLASHEVERQ